LEHPATFLIENLVVIVLAAALLLLLLVVFMSTGRRRPRQPLGRRGDRGLSSNDWDTRHDEAAMVMQGQGVKRGRHTERGGPAVAKGNPILLAMVVLALVGLVAAGIIAFGVIG
jgi:hypothetical protein